MAAVDPLRRQIWAGERIQNHREQCEVIDDDGDCFDGAARNVLEADIGAEPQSGRKTITTSYSMWGGEKAITYFAWVYYYHPRQQPLNG